MPSFKTFLSSHASILKELHLFNAELSMIEEQHVWIKFLRFMKNTLHLSDLSLGGRAGGKWHNIRCSSHSPFRSGFSIAMEDLARFLVCGRCPADMVTMDCNYLKLLNSS